MVAVTIGVGAYARMAEYAAEAVRRSTGLPTIIIGDAHHRRCGLRVPHFLKFRLFELVDADDLLFFDADLVCLARWDPSRFREEDGIVCVRERMCPAILEQATRWNVPAEQYFNSGLFIINRRRHQVWLALAEDLAAAHDMGFFDQTPLNVARCRLRLPLRLIDRRYNFLGFGAGNLCNRIPIFMAHCISPSSKQRNLDYFEGKITLPTREPIAIDETAWRSCDGATFDYLVDNELVRSLRLRSDGTLLPPADGQEEGYWFMEHNGRLNLASETEIIQQFIRAEDGTWQGAEPLVSARLIPAERGPHPVIIDDRDARPAADRFLRQVPTPPGAHRGRGIVICAGGSKYFPSAWVCISMLRRLDCRLPIELWHLGEMELDQTMRALLQPLDVRCVDGLLVRRRHPVRILRGWELKPYAILHSAFQEVLLIDADNVPLIDPASLFDLPEYGAAGALFWPDLRRLAPDRRIWAICGVDYRDEPEFESGQMLVDKSRCWQSLQLTMHLNEHSDFYYRHIHGDKETFHMAWRMLDQPYAMVPHPVHLLQGCMCQHDFAGRRIFQHRNLAKWSLTEPNPRIEGFHDEPLCLSFLNDLRSKWDGSIRIRHDPTPPEQQTARRLAAQGLFRYIRVGYDARTIQLLPDGRVGEGSGACEEFWYVRQRADDRLMLVLAGSGRETCRLTLAGAEWRGRWLVHERMPVRLLPL